MGGKPISIAIIKKTVSGGGIYKEGASSKAAAEKRAKSLRRRGFKVTVGKDRIGYFVRVTGRRKILKSGRMSRKGC